MRGMSPGVVAAKKRLGVGVVGGGGFALGCGCRDAKAVAVAASSASPYSATTTEASTATTATWHRARASHPSASASTGTLTVPSASSSSFLWEEAEADGDGEEVNCKGVSLATTPSFSGLLRQLNELEQSVVSWGQKSTNKSDLPPPPPPLPSRPVKHRVVHGGDRRDIKEGHGNFSPPPPPSSFQSQSQQRRKEKSMDRGDMQEGEAHFTQPPTTSPPLPPPPEQPKSVKNTGKGSSKEDGNNLPPRRAPTHRKAKSCDSRDAGRLEGGVAVVKQSEDPLGDFRRSMVNMIVENGIVTGDELRALLRRFLDLNAPHHHDSILRAFTEIWDEAFATKPTQPQQRNSAATRAPPPAARPPPPRHKASPHRRQPPRAWR